MDEYDIALHLHFESSPVAQEPPHYFLSFFFPPALSCPWKGLKLAAQLDSAFVHETVRVLCSHSSCVLRQRVHRALPPRRQRCVMVPQRQRL